MDNQTLETDRVEEERRFRDEVDRLRRWGERQPAATMTRIAEDEWRNEMRALEKRCFSHISGIMGLSPERTRLLQR